MKTTYAVRRAGTKAELARILGIKKQSLTTWPESVPVKREQQLRELRPEWFKGGKRGQ